MPATPKSAMRTRAQDKSRQARVDAKARKACVEAVWKRASYGVDNMGKCERCGVIVMRDGPLWSVLGHVHEKRARSLGGDPHDPNQCELLCFDCHFPNGAHRRSVRTV